MTDRHQSANDADHADRHGLEQFKQHRIIWRLFGHGLGDKNQTIKHPSTNANQANGKRNLCAKLPKGVPIIRGSSVSRHCKFPLSQGLWYTYQTLHTLAAHIQAFPNYRDFGKGSGRNHGNRKAKPTIWTAPKYTRCSFLVLFLFYLTP